MGRSSKPWVRKETGLWYAWIDGKQRKLAGGTKDRAKAYRDFHAIKSKTGSAARKAEDMAIHVIADMYFDSVKMECEPEYFVILKRRLKDFIGFSGKDKPAMTFRPHDISQWLASKKWKANTRRTGANIVKRMFAWTVEQGYIDESPVAKFRPPAATARIAIMTTAQADAALPLAVPELRDFLIGLRETGCRPKELETLTADRVNIEDGTWKVLDKIRKKTGNKYRTIYLTTGMVEMSRRLVAQNPEGLIFRTSRGLPWNNVKLTGAVRWLRGRKELKYGPEFVAYAFRHLYVTDALERGVNPASLAELIGHRDLTMIMSVYSKLRGRTEHLREAAEIARGNSSVKNDLAASRPAAQSGDNPPSHGNPDA